GGEGEEGSAGVGGCVSVVWGEKEDGGGEVRSWQKRGLISFGLGFLLFIVAAATIEVDGANVLTLILLAASGVFVVAAFVLVAVGSRVEKKGKGGYGEGYHVATEPQWL